MKVLELYSGIGGMHFALKGKLKGITEKSNIRTMKNRSRNIHDNSSHR